MLKSKEIADVAKLTEFLVKLSPHQTDAEKHLVKQVCNRYPEAIDTFFSNLSTIDKTDRQAVMGLLTLAYRTAHTVKLIQRNSVAGSIGGKLNTEKVSVELKPGYLYQEPEFVRTNIGKRYVGTIIPEEAEGVTQTDIPPVIALKVASALKLEKNFVDKSHSEDKNDTSKRYS